MAFGTFGKAFPRDPGGQTRYWEYPPQRAMNLHYKSLNPNITFS